MYKYFRMSQPVNQSDPVVAEQSGEVSAVSSSSELDAAKGYPIPHEFIAKNLESPIRASSAKSVDTPMTADLSWASDFPDASSMSPTEAEERAIIDAKIERENAKMDRMKAKAIKSANKELGVDQKLLASALGLESSSGVDSQNSGMPDQIPEEGEMSQMKYLADSLGLPPSFFGVPADAVESPKKTLEYEQIVPDNGDEKTAADFVDPDPAYSAPPVRKGEFKPHPVTVEQKRQDKEKAMTRLNRIKAKAIKSATKSLGVDKNNLSAAVGMSLEEVDVSSRKKSKQKMQRTGSAQELQFIADSLGLPVGLFGVPETTVKSNEKVQDIAPQEEISIVAQPLPGSLASALGVKVAQPFDGAVNANEKSVASSSGGVQPQTGSLAAALGMAVDDSAIAPPVRQVVYEKQTEVSQATSPMAGSLAAALGMHVDSSPSSPAVRQSKETEALPKAPAVARGSLAAALGASVAISPESMAAFQKPKAEAPLPGSLAAALGVSAGHSKSVPVVQPEQVRQGSLAEALGMKVTTSTARKNPTTAQPLAGSLAAALGMSVDSSMTAPPVAQAQDTSGKAQAGSLAAALGMSVDSSSQSPVIRQATVSTAGGPHTAMGIQAGSLAAALGVSVDTRGKTPNIEDTRSRETVREVSTDRKAPVAGSLMEALSMKTASSSSPTQSGNTTLADEGSEVESGSESCSESGSESGSEGSEDSDDDSAEEHTSEQAVSAVGSGKSLFGQVFSSVVAMQSKSHEQQTGPTSQMEVANPQSGSLAAALGMAVTPAPQAPAPVPAEVGPRSLAAALGMRVSSPSSELLKPVPAPARNGNALPGSLAAALGAPVSSSSPEPQNPSPSQPLPGSLAAALGVPVSSSSLAPPASVPPPTQVGNPLAGSLAAALGMSVSPSPPAPMTSNRALPQVAKPQPRSLADALGMSVSSSLPAPERSAPAPVAKPQPRSLADALGMSVSSSLPAPRAVMPPVTSNTRALPLEPEVAEYSEVAEAYTAGPTSDTEILLRVELASAKAETAGAKAYGKALEQQMTQMSQAFAGKLSELQEQISSYELEVAGKSLEIESLENEMSQEQEAQDLLMNRLQQTNNRLQQTRAMMDETDAMLHQEFAEIRLSRSSYQHRYNGGGSVTSDGGSSSNRTRDIHKTLEREGSRRQSLKARLQVMRAMRASNDSE